MDLDSLSGRSSSSVNSYHKKFQDYCHLVDSEGNLGYYGESATSKNDSGYDMHDENSDDISHQSQGSLIESVNSKSDLYNLELGIHVSHSKDIDNLLRHSRQLEFELSTSKEQVQRLLKNNSKTRDISIRDNYFELERKYSELKSCNSTLQLNICQMNSEIAKIVDHNKHLQIDRKHCLVDLETKNAVITELKQKVCDQFVQIQKLTQTSNEKTLQLNQLNCELQQAKNCYDWFKLQLRNCQKDKTALMTELANLKSEIIHQKEEISLLNIDKENIRIQLETLQFETSTDRPNECEVCRDDLNHASVQTETIQDNNETYLTWYKENLNELRNEILQLKVLMAGKDEILHKTSAESSTAVSQCITLQKKLQETIHSVDHLKNENFNLKTEMKLQESTAEIHEKTKTELATLKSVLLENQKEKEHIQTFVDIIRKQLSQFEMKFNYMNRDIADKNKQILELQQDIQKLYMEKNWQICELEKMKEKEKLISELKNETQKYIRTVDIMETKQQKMESQYFDLHNEKNELSRANLQQIQRYEMVLQQYKDLLLGSEIKLSELNKSYIDSTKALSDKNVAMDKLIIELDQKNSIISELDCMVRESENALKNIKEHKNILENTKEDQSDCEQNVGIYNGDREKEIEKLKVMLKVKDLDGTERQKKFEANTSTLLRKVREQISEKKVIKKQYADEFNCLKLSYETLKREKETLESVVFKLQQGLKDESFCNKCSEYEFQLRNMERQIEEWKSNHNNLKAKLDEMNYMTENSEKNGNELISNEKCKILNAWKTQLEMQNELESVNREKFFLQRLNNDLKFALKKQVNYNKILQEGVLKQSEFLSLPNNSTHVQKYDENQINRILQKNKGSLEKNKFSEIHSCLDSMKRNIQAIQEDIVNKNRK